MKKLILSLILIIALILPVFAAEGVAPLAKMPSLSVASIGGDWAVIALARAGEQTDALDNYYKNALDYIEACGGVLHKSRMTEYSRVALALAAIGRDPMNAGGYDILSPLLDADTVTRQGVNSAAWALITLDCGIEVPAGADDAREVYIAYLLKTQAADGSICDLPGSEPEYTAMAMRALANYTDRAEVKAAVDAGLAYLVSVWSDAGGFPSKWGKSSEPIAQVIITLCTLGIHPDDAGFSGTSLPDALLAYRLADGTFAHTPGGTTNQMATEQAALAFLALERLAAKESPLFDFSDVARDTSAVTKTFGLPGKSPAVNPPSIVNPGITFPDFYEESSARKAAAQALAERGIWSGYEDGTFRPDKSLTRAEFAAILVRALGLPTAADAQSFSDVPRDAWYFAAVETAYNYRLVSGVGAHKFNPEGTVTREEAAVMIARAAKLSGCDTARSDTMIRSALSPFADYQSASDWAREALAFCVDESILDAEAMTLEPSAKLTRGEAAIMLHALYAAARFI
ncbi:MAG: S-layer homology domain-containing protein [Clostridia bacterium]|nr:S-layer homology domain-containing protein [Clostridia bacterium]